MDAGVGVMIFMGVVLKIPVAFACWLIWKALTDTPDPAEASDDGGGHPFRRFRREPKRPQGPRRGPHAPDALPLPCPDEGGLRIRTGPITSRPLTASGRGERLR